MICPAPARYTKGRAVLAFLDRQESGEYRTHALSYGANDLDGTVTWERIYHMAGSQTPEEMTEQRLREVIEEAGRTPVERDAFYNVIDGVIEKEEVTA